MKKSVKILIMVLCLIIVGLVTFIVVDKIINIDKIENSANIVEKKDSELNYEKYQITSEIKHNDSKQYMVISAYNSEKKLVWSYTTDTVNVPQYENLKYFGDTYNSTNQRKLVYVAVDSKIIALDYQNGELVWENNNDIVAVGPSCIDKFGNLYTSCEEHFEIAIINSDGKTVKKLNGLQEEISVGSGEGFWMNEMSLEDEDNDAKLKVSFGEVHENNSEHEYVIKVNLNNYEIEKNEINENKSGSYDNESSNITTSSYIEEYKKIIDKNESENPNNSRYSLIYFNNDDIPDLVVDCGAISLYMYENGTVYTLMDVEPYGIGGCKYYDYYERKGVISSFGTSLAGLVCGEDFYILNSKKELEHTFSCWLRGADPGDNEEMKEQVEKELNEYGGYKYKGQKITEDEFESKLKEYGVEFSTDKLWNTESSIKKALGGTKTPSEVKQQLEK